MNSADQNILSQLIAAVPLPGDFDGSGTVDQLDYQVWRASFGQTGSGLAADGNGNGVIDTADYVLWRNNLPAAVPLPGDFDGSGTVDQLDYQVWRASFGQTGSGLAADGNGNGVIDTADYVLWRNNLPAAVPLPGDFDGSGTVDQLDYQVWRASFGQTGSGLAADGNGNGVIDTADYVLWRNNLPAAVPLPGDFDGSGTVDQLDYQVWRASFGQTGSGLAADGNGNGVIDTADYVLWRNNLPAAVPLPGDFDGSGTVDQLDYQVWRASFGQTGSGLAADGNGNGVIDTADYVLWRNNLGSGLGFAAITAPLGLAVPATALRKLDAPVLSVEQPGDVIRFAFRIDGPEQPTACRGWRATQPILIGDDLLPALRNYLTPRGPTLRDTWIRPRTADEARQHFRRRSTQCADWARFRKN